MKKSLEHGLLSMRRSSILLGLLLIAVLCVVAITWWGSRPHSQAHEPSVVGPEPMAKSVGAEAAGSSQNLTADDFELGRGYLLAGSEVDDVAPRVGRPAVRGR